MARERSRSERKTYVSVMQLRNRMATVDGKIANKEERLHQLGASKGEILYSKADQVTYWYFMRKK
jgi:hypothetical protein